MATEEELARWAYVAGFVGGLLVLVGGVLTLVFGGLLDRGALVGNWGGPAWIWRFGFLPILLGTLLLAILGAVGIYLATLIRDEPGEALKVRGALLLVLGILADPGFGALVSLGALGMVLGGAFALAAGLREG